MSLIKSLFGNWAYSPQKVLCLSRHCSHIPDHLPDTMRYFDYVPFSQVLPRAAALIYHGGIGTLAQAMAAGIPHLIMSDKFIHLPQARNHDTHDL